MDFKNEAKALSEAYASMYQQEGFKPFPKAKVQDKAAMKPDTAKGEKQARNMDNARTAHTDKDIAPIAKGAVKEREQDNKKKGLEKKFADPSAKKGKNDAYKLEGQRRRDLDNRYGSKKEDVAQFLLDKGYALDEGSAIAMVPHISEEWLNVIIEDRQL